MCEWDASHRDVRVVVPDSDPESSISSQVNGVSPLQLGRPAQPGAAHPGILERGDGGVSSLLADNLDILDLGIAQSSRDFR